MHQKRLKDDVQQVMRRANQEAQRFNQECIGPEHILLAIIQEEDCRGRQLLEGAMLNLGKLKLQVEARTSNGPEMTTMGILPPNPAAQMVMAAANVQREALGASELDSGHLLL